MKYFTYLLIVLPGFASASCPNEVFSGDKNFCVGIEWDYGEIKVRGEFESTETLTPYLIPMGEVPQKWVYSKAYIIVWEKGDLKRTPVEIENFRIFPYMHMANGHHHSTGYNFFFDPTGRTYVFRRVAFLNMRGRWSLRWTTDSKDLKETSHLLTEISEFQNEE